MFPVRFFIAFLTMLLLASSAPEGFSQMRPALPYAEEDIVPPWRMAVNQEQVRVELSAEASPPPKPIDFYDPAAPDRAYLQSSDEGLAGLPRDARGAVDWVRALRSGAIAPRADVQGSASQQVLDLDIVMKNTKDMPHVRFPHKAHTEWLACSNCHDQIFIPKAGANPVSMEKIFRGEYCGTCHDRVAFVSHHTCERCHNIQHGDVRRWW